MLSREIYFQHQKYQVLHNTSPALAEYGKYFVIGYDNFSEVKTLVQSDAIAGIYIYGHNLDGLTKEQFRAQMDELQSIRQDRRLAPLLVATDQEGGIVCRLAPMVPCMPALSGDHSDAEIAAAAREQAEALAELGINVNFAPVVDLGGGETDPLDRYSLIASRAISDDPEVIIHRARIYIQELNKAGISGTLKHFPGLGSVATDTHIFNADLEKPIASLLTEDWPPYATLGADTQSLIMLSHVILPEVDSKPSSLSQKLIEEIIRGELGLENDLITDDFSMVPIAYYPGGVTFAAEEAIAAGVDYILIAYNSDLYYQIMADLLKKDR